MLEEKRLKKIRCPVCERRTAFEDEVCENCGAETSDVVLAYKLTNMTSFSVRLILWGVTLFFAASVYLFITEPLSGPPSHFTAYPSYLIMLGPTLIVIAFLILLLASGIKSRVLYSKAYLKKLLANPKAFYKKILCPYCKNRLPIESDVCQNCNRETGGKTSVYRPSYLTHVSRGIIFFGVALSIGALAYAYIVEKNSDIRAKEIKVSDGETQRKERKTYPGAEYLLCAYLLIVVGLYLRWTIGVKRARIYNKADVKSSPCARLLLRN